MTSKKVMRLIQKAFGWPQRLQFYSQIDPHLTRDAAGLELLWPGCTVAWDINQRLREWEDLQLRVEASAAQHTPCSECGAAWQSHDPTLGAVICDRVPGLKTRPSHKCARARMSDMLRLTAYRRTRIGQNHLICTEILVGHLSDSTITVNDCLIRMEKAVYTAEPATWTVLR